MVDLRNCDFKKEISNIKSESIDLVVTDPPYPVISGGTPPDPDRPTGILEENDGKIFDHNSIKYEEYIPELYRVLKPNTHCYIMINNIGLRKCLNIANDVGFGFHNLLIWKKDNVTPNRWYMKNAEYILFLWKGTAKPINNPSQKQILEVENIKGDKDHPTQKPVELMEIMIKNSSQKGDLVFDPFVGSGSSALASFRNNRDFVGFELDKEFYKKAQKKIKNEKNKDKFFK